MLLGLVSENPLFVFSGESGPVAQDPRKVGGFGMPFGVDKEFNIPRIGGDFLPVHVVPSYFPDKIRPGDFLGGRGKPVFPATTSITTYINPAVRHQQRDRLLGLHVVVNRRVRTPGFHNYPRMRHPRTRTNIYVPPNITYSRSQDQGRGIPSGKKPKG